MKILVAEDSKTYRTVLRGSLGKWGYDVVETDNGLRAWDMLRREDAPRLAILDWQMPGLDGIEVCRRVKQSDKLPFTYVIMLTSRDAREDMVEGLGAGADEYLVKPADLVVLECRLAAARRIVELVPPKEWSAPRIRGYVVERQLGKGAFATVWEATEEATNRRVALKVLRVDLASGNVAERFVREIEMMKRLDHPGIAEVYAGHVDETVGYCALEYVDGWTLEEFANRDRLKPGRVLRLVSAIGKALHHAHENGVLHRDLKPSNVMITREGKVKIVDFGLGKSLFDLGAEDSAQSMDGTVIGTPLFMAPEQARGEEVDGRADVYALGIILYVLLLRRHPHDVDDKDRWETIDEIAEGTAHLPSEFLPKFNAELEKLMMKALEAEPRRRYQSAAEFAEAIDAFIAKRIRKREQDSGRPSRPNAR